MLPSLFRQRVSLRLLFPIIAFVFSAIAGISVAAWLDAPNAPPNYGIIGCTPPCGQEDFKPMNLSTTAQTKRAGVTFEGDVIGNQFQDLQNNAYFLDPASPISSGNLAGALNVTGALFTGALNVNQSSSGAKLVVNNPSTATKIGSPSDAIYAYANSSNAAISAEQANSAGYGIYSSGGINYFGGNVGIGTTSPTQKLTVAGTIESTTGGFKFPDGTTQVSAASGSNWTSQTDSSGCYWRLPIPNGWYGFPGPYFCDPGYVVTGLYYSSGAADERQVRSMYCCRVR